MSSVFPEEVSAGKNGRGAVAFALVYLTFFLDNVLLTVLVPMMPSWVRGVSHVGARTPLVDMLNHTLEHMARNQLEHGRETAPWSGGAAQAVVGIVLSAKAAVQLMSAPPAAAAVARHGAVMTLRVATGLLALAAIVLASCGAVWGSNGAWCCAAGRAFQGGGAAAAAVAGLTIAAELPHHGHAAVAAALGATALGVLVGYPFGGISLALGGRAAPFLLIAAALLFDLAMQYMFLDTEEFPKPQATQEDSTPSCNSYVSFSCGCSRVFHEAKAAGSRASALAVFLTSSVLTALEPALPLYIEEKLHSQSDWSLGWLFVPDALGYVLGSTWLGGAGVRRAGAEGAAVGGQLAVAAAAFTVTSVSSVWQLSFPQFLAGIGVGTVDAALMPALLAPSHSDNASSRSHRAAKAALLHAASSAAALLGPIVGGLLSWWIGLPATLHALAIANLVHAVLLAHTLQQHPLDRESEDSFDEDSSGREMLPLRPGTYTTLREYNTHVVVTKQ